jgi:hypothetical protein
MQKSEVNPIINDLKDNLFELVIERERDGYKNDLESFESYKARRKDKIAEEYNSIFSQIGHGYQVILEIIAQDLDSKEDNSNQKIVKP